MASKGLIALALLFLSISFGSKKEVDPTFKDVPGGWEPQCPINMLMVRKDPQPECMWGKKLMPRKPTQDQFKCISAKKAQKLPVCDNKF